LWHIHITIKTELPEIKTELPDFILVGKISAEIKSLESKVNTEHRLRDFGKVASSAIKQYLPSQKSLPIGGASAAD
jgi:hypothetical protein